VRIPDWSWRKNGVPVREEGDGMIAQIIFVIIFAPVAIAFVAWLQKELLVSIYRRGYERGRKDASDWWTQVAKDVEQMGQQIKDEER
jgi:hypothetical protein